MRMPKCCNNPCFRDRKLRALCTVSFGLGMVLAQISPEGLVLFIAAVVIWIGLSIFISGKNNPKNLIKAAGVVVGIAVLVVLAYVLSSGAPAINVKTQPTTQWLKLTDTMLLLTYVLGGAAIVAIIVGAIRDAFNNK